MLLLALGVSGACTEKSDDLGRTCTSYVQTGRYRCDELTGEGYDCHCACPEAAPTPAPTFLVDWHPQTGTACLTCLNPRSIFYYHDTREECLQRCENAIPDNGPNEVCEAVTWFDVPIYRSGFEMNCCTLEKPCSRTKPTVNATVFTPTFQNCLLEAGSEVIPGFYIRDVLWRNCGSDASLHFLSPAGETLWKGAVNASGDWWFSEFKMPEDAEIASSYEVQIRGSDGQQRAGTSIKVIPPSCSNGCGLSVSDLGCTCSTPCGPPGGFYDVCCDDMTRFCSAEKDNCTIWMYPYAIPANMGDHAINMTLQWWGCEPGTLHFGTMDPLVTPGFGHISFPSTNWPQSGRVPVQLTGANGKTLNESDFVISKSKSKWLDGSLTVNNKSYSMDLYMVGVDNNLAKMNYWGGYHRTYFSRDTILAVPGYLSSAENVSIGTSVQYMMEQDAEPLTLAFSSFTLRGKFETDSYNSEGDQFDSGDWKFTGDVVSKSEVIGSFDCESPQPPPARVKRID